MIDVRSYAVPKKGTSISNFFSASNYIESGGGSGSGSSGGSGGSGGGSSYEFEPHYLWGQYFDDTQDIDGDLTSTGKITSREIETLSAVTEYLESITLNNKGNASISGNTVIGGTASISGDTTTRGNMSVSGNTTMGGTASISGNTTIRGNASISGDSKVGQDFTVYGETIGHGQATLLGGVSTTDIESDNITNTNAIRTKNLYVTGTAHFFELIIDKVKAAGGAVLFTPADGFDIDIVEDKGDTYRLYFQATDGERAISNMWKVGDQALCKSFNEARPGTSYNVSNKYYWTLVSSVSENPVEVTQSGSTAVYHYIEVSKTVKDGELNPERGDSIAMLGYRGTDDPARQSAIYISAYSSLDLGLTAPLYATYRGINDFNLESHRKTYIDANGSKFFGDFYINDSTTVTDYVDHGLQDLEATFQVDIDEIKSEVKKTEIPNMLPSNDWTYKDLETPLFQEDDETYSPSGNTYDEMRSIPPVIWMDKGMYTFSIYGRVKYNPIAYGSMKTNLDQRLTVETMINFADTWHNEPRSVIIFPAPINGYYRFDIEPKSSSYTGDTAYHEVDESGTTSADTSISIQADSTYGGGTEEVYKEVSPSGYQGVVTYTSSNPEVATVDENGVITGVGQGTATITANLGAGYIDGVYYKPSSASTEISVQTEFQVVMSGVGDVTMYRGDTAVVHPTIRPSHYSGDVQYVSLDENVFTVSQTGLVSGVGVGSATLRVIAPDAETEYSRYSGTTSEATVTVIKEKVPVEDWYFTNTPYRLDNEGDELNTSLSKQLDNVTYSVVAGNGVTIDSNGKLTRTKANGSYAEATIRAEFSGDTQYLSATTDATVTLTEHKNLYCYPNNGSRGLVLDVGETHEFGPFYAVENMPTNPTPYPNILMTFELKRNHASTARTEEDCAVVSNIRKVNSGTTIMHYVTVSGTSRTHYDEYDYTEVWPIMQLPARTDTLIWNQSYNYPDIAIFNMKEKGDPQTSYGSSEATVNIDSSSLPYTAVPQALTNPNNVPVTYSLSGADTTYVSIDASTGAITLNENTPLGQEIVFRVVATSSETPLYNQKSVYYIVQVYCEKPVARIGWTSATKSLNLNASGLPYTGTPQSLENPDSVPVTYSLSGTDTTNLSINQSTGEITIPSTFTTNQSVTVNVVAQSQETAEYKSTSAYYALTIYVTKQLEDPQIRYRKVDRKYVDTQYSALPYTTIPQELTNPNNVPVTYSLSGADETYVSIDSSTGAITLNKNTPIRSAESFRVVATSSQTEQYKQKSVYYIVQIYCS